MLFFSRCQSTAKSVYIKPRYYTNLAKTMFISVRAENRGMRGVCGVSKRKAYEKSSSSQSGLMEGAQLPFKNEDDTLSTFTSIIYINWTSTTLF